MILAATKVLMNAEYTCGNLEDLVFSGTFPYIISAIVLLIKIAVPVLLIIFGMLDLGKAVVAAKEDEIKKGQQTFVKRLVTAIIIFFVVQLVQIVIRFVSSNDTDIVGCFNCFINGYVDDDNACISQ